MTWTNQAKNLSTFVDQVKNFLVGYLLYTDGLGDEGFLMYTDGLGDQGKIIIIDNRFENLTKHESMFTNQVKH